MLGCSPGAVYRIPQSSGKSAHPIRPQLPNGNIDTAAMARLSSRHDDIEDNLENRSNLYELHNPGLRAAFAFVSATINAQHVCETIHNAAAKFITIEHSNQVEIVPSCSLKDAAYQIVDVLKYRREPLVCMHQADGKEFWAKMSELAENTNCLLLHRDPTAFSTAQSHVRSSLKMFNQNSLLFVESAEPVQILASLSVGIQFPLEHTDTQACGIVVITGPSKVGKSTFINMLCRDHPDKVERIARVGSGSRAKDMVEIGEREFALKSEKGALLVAYELYGIWIGVERSEVDRVRQTGKLGLLELDPDGCAQLTETGIPLCTMFLSVGVEGLDKRMRDLPSILHEEDLQKRLCKGIEQLENLGANDGAHWDHVVNTDCLSTTYNVIKEALSQYWPQPIVPNECSLLVDFHKWSIAAFRPACRRMSCTASCATTIELPRGKHLLGLHVDQEFLHALQFLSHAKFQVKDASSLLKEKEKLAVQKFEGDHLGAESENWCLLFRYKYTVADISRVSAELQLNDDSSQR